MVKRKVEKPKNKCFLSVLVVLFFLSLPHAVTAQEAVVTKAETVFIETVVIQGEENNFVSYPVLQGEDAITQKINQDILQSAQIDAYISLLETMSQSSVGLQVQSTFDQVGHYVSIVISANGKMLFGPPSQQYYAMMYDLETGDRVPFETLFTQVETALEEIEYIVDYELWEIMSTYMDNSDLLPLPDSSFALLHGALVLFYDNDQFSFLSGNSGAVAIKTFDLEGLIKAEFLEETAENPLENIKQDIAKAQLPALHSLFLPKIELLMEAQPLLDALHQTIDPSFHTKGSIYEVEDPLLRGTYFVIDEKGEQVVSIMSNSLDMYGIITGYTTVSQWRAILGEPTSTFTMDEQTAQDNHLVVGTSDIYTFDEGISLKLHATMEGVLYAVSVE